ncbi:MAG: hypothetical protein ABI877_16655 [Gemmatimonadaceae bacterium]
MLAGVLADAMEMSGAIHVVGALTIASGVVVALRFREDRRPEGAPLGAFAREPFAGVKSCMH